MMAFDFIKSIIESKNPKELENHPLLNFKVVVTERTGEMSRKKVAKYKGMKFIIIGNKASIEGSLHYYYNNGKHNYNDFTLDMVNSVLNELETVFSIDLSTSKIENIEVGVNIETGYNTQVILNNLLFHGTRKFKDKEVNKGKGDYRVMVKDRFSIKAYNKSLQFGLDYELFRFEIHYRKMTDLKRYNIVYLSDLKDKKKLEFLKNEILKEWEKLFLFDWSIKGYKIPKSEKPKSWKSWNLPHFWICDLNKSNRSKIRRNYGEIVNKYSNNIQKKIGLMIEKKMNELIYTKGDLFTRVK